MFERVWQRYRARDVAFDNVLVPDTDAKARDSLTRHRVSFPSGYDWDVTIATPLGLEGMPYTILIGRNGEAAHKLVGRDEREGSEPGTRQLLGAPQTSRPRIRASTERFLASIADENAHSLFSGRQNESRSEGVRSSCRRMACSVPFGTSPGWLGITVERLERGLCRIS